MRNVHQSDGPVVKVTGACGHTWEATHAELLAGTWDVCPMCAGDDPGASSDQADDGQRS